LGVIVLEGVCENAREVLNKQPRKRVFRIMGKDLILDFKRDFMPDKF